MTTIEPGSVEQIFRKAKIRPGVFNVHVSRTGATMKYKRIDALSGMKKKVACGLYRTTKPIDERIPADTLVYFHNHGNPGPGVYPVERWSHNKAVFMKGGVLIPTNGYEQTLMPLKPEAFYRVIESFYCCEKHCRLFEKNTLVQLGYNGHGEAILFVPVWSFEGLHLPEKGTRVDEEKLDKIEILKVEAHFDAEPDPFADFPDELDPPLKH